MENKLEIPQINLPKIEGKHEYKYLQIYGPQDLPILRIADYFEGIDHDMILIYFARQFSIPTADLPNKEGEKKAINFLDDSDYKLVGAGSLEYDPNGKELITPMWKYSATYNLQPDKDHFEKMKPVFKKEGLIWKLIE